MITLPFPWNCQNSGNAIVFLTMQDWDTDELIRKNLQRLIDKYDAGNQSAFSRRFGFKASYINGILAGDRSLGKPNLEVICKKLGIHPSEFFKSESTVREEQAAYRFKEAQSLGVDEQVRVVVDAIIEQAKKNIGSANDLKTRARKHYKRLGLEEREKAEKSSHVKEGHPASPGKKKAS